MKRKKMHAFSLVELMAALAVMMVLVTLALPRYRVFVATSRQAEAQANLGMIAQLQQTYQLKYIGQYYDNSDFKMGLGSGGTCANNENSQNNELGFRVPKCDKLRYTYITPSSFLGEAKNDGSHADRYIYPNCGSADAWTINRNRNLNNNIKVMVNCGG